MNNKIHFILGFVITVVFSTNAFAKLQIGEIIRKSGPKVTVNGKVVKASMPLFWGDRLISGPDTTLDILIYPSMAIKLNPSSEMKLIGSLIEKAQKSLNSTSAIQVVKGKIQGHLSKSMDIKNNVKVFTRKTVSAIRGTTFEISEEGEIDSVEVYEGEVEVSSLANENPNSTISVSAGNEVTTADMKPQAVVQKETPTLPTTEEIKTAWNKNSEVILSAHAKEAKKYKEILDRDVSSMYKGLQKDAKGMFQSTKGAYDQFKKKK